jgi:hypothetical protein
MTLEAETSDALAVQRCPMTHGGSPQAASRRAARPALTPNAVIRRLTNSIVPDAAGGFVSVLIGLCDFATSFLCFLPSIGRLVERCGEGDKGDAIDRRKIGSTGVAIGTAEAPAPEPWTGRQQ